MRYPCAILIALTLAGPASGQYRNCADLDRINRRLAGHVVDGTHNHGADRREFSPILGQPRDLYVYLPPGYTPRKAYPLIVYLHMAYVDEHALLGFRQVETLDQMILRGEVPPVIVACPDGTIDGRNAFRSPHSLFVNGIHGRFEDHILYEVLPSLTRRYSIRPERQAHAVMGASAGGYGAMSLAIRHRDVFGAGAAVAGPLNLRYSNIDDDYREDFDPATYRWRTHYDPNQVVGLFYFGLGRVPARRYITPVFGEPPGVEARLARTNPADVLFSSGLRPGESALYVDYPGRDNWNFDAQAESFLWLAAGRGLAVDAFRDPPATHTLPYFRRAHPRAYRWLGCHLLPPADLAPPPLPRPASPPQS